ncbi:hypothetical protein ABZP36_000507 [Zizania latifolia]
MSSSSRVRDGTLVPSAEGNGGLSKWIGVKRSNLRGFQCRREEPFGGGSIEVVVEGLNPVIVLSRSEGQRRKVCAQESQDCA